MANERWHLLVPKLVLQMYSAVFFNCVSVARRSSFHKNWHQTQYKLNLQYCMKLFRFKDKCGKMLTHGKFGLWCYQKYVKFISRFFLYSWKMASCGFVVWNWNLKVCFSSAEINNTLEGINSRISEAEERISELENKMVEINSEEQNKIKRMKRT